MSDNEEAMQRVREEVAKLGSVEDIERTMREHFDVGDYREDARRFRVPPRIAPPGMFRTLPANIIAVVFVVAYFGLTFWLTLGGP